jgi:hypothetical protein
MRRVLLGGAAVILVVLAASYMLADVIPRTSLTMTRLEILRMAGEKFRRAAGTCPVSVSQLAEASPKRPQIVDGWGRPIVLRCDPQTGAILASLGADGKRGGHGEDSDISVSF